MRCARRLTLGGGAVLGVAAMAMTALAPGATAAAPSTFSGSCQFSGPITPDPPITLIPKPGPHFSFHGTGTCTGAAAGAAVAAAPITVTFTHVSTAFDTCELGPDFGLPGIMELRSAAGTTRFAITVNLARLALTGPFALTTAGDGRALGLATFTPPNPATALSDCAGPGIATATLGGSFSTLSPLVGAAVTPAATAQPAVPAQPGVMPLTHPTRRHPVHHKRRRRPRARARHRHR